jgi:FixJ family two-component response regulator
LDFNLPNLASPGDHVLLLSRHGFPVNFAQKDLIMRNAGEISYVVDDEACVRDAVCAMLESAEIEVMGFDSAEAYLRHARSDLAACLITDLRMPGINGLELQQRLRAQDSPPIIFISGRGDVPSTVRAMKAGAIEFLTKPLDSNALLTAVIGAFATDRAQRQQRAELNQLQQRLSLLSPREREVLPLIVTGMLNKQAASVLGITGVTLQIHRSQIMRKMAARSFADLVRMAGRLGIPRDPASVQPVPRRS